VGVTDNYSLPYPECDPPLRKDASDIAQVRDLAVAADTASVQVRQDASNLMVRPDACRMLMSAFVAGTGSSTVVPFFNLFGPDTSPGGYMHDTVNGVINLVEPGRYLIGGYVNTTCTIQLSPRVRYLLDGQIATNLQTSGFISQTNAAVGFASVVLAVDRATTLQMQVVTDALVATVWTYSATMYALQIERF
jgi:hypothetical protein